MIVFTDEDFSKLTSFVKVNYGIDLSAKRTFVQLRIQKLMEQHGYDSFAAYFQYVCTDITGIAVSGLISSMTVNYTLFNRESFHFDYLANEVLPYLYDKELKTRDFRIWSAGCATGEEPYTLAIVLSDFLGIRKNTWDMQILATDISEFALKKAIVGTYPTNSIEALNPEWVNSYFIPDPNDKDSVQVSPEIKQEVIFRKLNLVKDAFMFKQKFQIIFCRNVMIYFDEATKYELIRKFYNSLEEGGYLFIGMSETLDLSACPFQHVVPSVYRKGGA